MVRVDTRGRVNLQAVVTVACILKQAIHWVQNIMGHMEEPLSEGKKKKKKQNLSLHEYTCALL